MSLPRGKAKQDFLLEELAERAPAVVDVIFEQTLRGNQAADSATWSVDLLTLPGNRRGRKVSKSCSARGKMPAAQLEVRHEPVLWV